MKQFLILFLACTFSVYNVLSQVKENSHKVIHFEAKDGVKITADLYLLSQTKAPFIILYHQAGYSRGEYREIAPQLNQLGFSCMAIDQRSGKEVNGIVNQTNIEAVKLGKATKYANAIPDVDAALQYVKNNFNSDKIIVWGSSYSAALVLYLGGTYPGDIDGILAFSPGEYFKIDGKEIKTYASKIKCPVFITSAKKEQKSWQKIYDAVQSDKGYFLPEEDGKHGSKALWKNNSDHQEYWKSVTEFLNRIK